MLGSVLQLLPIALAAAFSSVPISIMIVILLSPRRRIAALPYMFGSVLGIVLVVTGAILLTSAAMPTRRPRVTDEWAGVIEIVLGCALLVVAVITWHRRNHVATATNGSRWKSVAEKLTPIKAFGLGVLLDLRPKSLLLAAVVGVQLRQEWHDPVSAVVLGLIYVVVATSTITVPILLTVLAPSRMEPRLTSASHAMAARGRAISAIVLALVAILVLIAGILNVT